VGWYGVMCQISMSALTLCMTSATSRHRGVLTESAAMSVSVRKDTIRSEKVA